MINEVYLELKEVESVFKIMVEKQVDIFCILNRINVIHYNHGMREKYHLTEEEFKKIKKTILEYKKGD